MKIQKVRPEHLHAVKALLDLCFGDGAWSMDALRSQGEKSDSRCTAAVENDEIIGFLAFEQILDEGSIVEIAVHPAHRRQGIARRLIEDAWKDNSLKEIFLEVRESNTPAVKLYESLGFQRVGIRKEYYDHPKEDAVLYRLPLPKGG